MAAVTVPLPDGWFDLDPDARDRQWPAVAARLGDRATPEVRRAYEEVLGGLSAAYAADGARWAAVRWRPETGAPPYAVLELRTADRLTAGDAAEEAAALAALLAVPLAGDVCDRRVERVPGPGVRLRMLGGSAAADGRRLVCDLGQWWLPGPRGDRTVVLTSSCADLTEGDEVAGVLAAAAAALRPGTVIPENPASLDIPAIPGVCSGSTHAEREGPRHG